MSPFNIDLKGDLTPIIARTDTILKPISEGFAGIFAYVFQKPIEYNIVSEIALEQLAKETRDKYNKISNNNITFENIKILGKILEDSIYQLDIKEFRRYYSSLASATLDKTQEVKPSYSSLIREMSINDVNLLDYFFKYNILFEFQVTSNNYLFDDPNLYRWFWNKQYFKISKVTDNFFYRDYNDKEKMQSRYTINQDYFEDSVESEVIFLLSKGIIREDPSENWHEYIPSIEKYVLDSDQQVTIFKNRNKYDIPKVIFDVKHKVYSLTSLGEELKKILIDDITTSDENDH